MTEEYTVEEWVADLEWNNALQCLLGVVNGVHEGFALLIHLNLTPILLDGYCFFPLA